ncbi:MAG TPA: zinc ribbon domain-containing protein [Bacillota bacterium]|nr:zinc ribbon domain-containing protein [Bacillota bacterium]
MPENKCHQCGAPLDSDSVFCQECGAKAVNPVVEQETQVPSSGAYQEPQAQQEYIQQPNQEQQYQQPYQEQQYSQQYAQQPYQEQQYPQQYAQQPYPEQQYPQQYAQQPYQEQQYPQQQYAQQPYQEQQYQQQPYQEPKAPKKRRWWIPVVIVLLAAAIGFGIWFFFFRGKSFASDAEAWHAAEEEAFNSKDSLFGSWRSSANKYIEAGKLGSGMELSLILNQIPDISESPEAAAIIEAVKNINIKVEAKMDFEQDAPQLSFFTALAKKDAEADAVSLNVYTVGEDIVVSIPELLDKPLVLSKETLEEMTGEDDIDQIFGSFDNLQEQLSIISDEKFEVIFADLREIFYKYSGDPERIKDSPLTVGSITDKLDLFVATIPAEKFPDFAKEILTYVRNNQDIRDFITGIGGSIADLYDMTNLNSFDEVIDDLIEELDLIPEYYQIELRRQLYVDSKNKPQADSFTIINHSEGEEIHYESLLAKDGDKGAYSLKFALPDDNSIEYASEFTEKGDLSTGNFQIVVTEDGVRNSDVNISGSFTDFGLDTKDDNFYLVGDLILTAASEDLSNAPVEVSYNGSVKKIGGVDHLLATVQIKADIYGSPLDIGLSTDTYVIAEKDIKFEPQLPADYIDLSDEEALSNLMFDESLLYKLMEVFSNLGIDPSNFMD